VTNASIKNQHDLAVGSGSFAEVIQLWDESVVCSAHSVIVPFEQLLDCEGSLVESLVLRDEQEKSGIAESGDRGDNGQLSIIFFFRYSYGTWFCVCRENYIWRLCLCW
jgi:hypothetical protein